jgi:oxygen-dependent protoporphyrinogen oxidase
MTAAIIGGGIAGLTAAYELVKAGERPYLIEPGRIGGMIRSEQATGFTLEYGPNVLVVRPDLKYLLDELGLQAAATPPCIANYGQYVWYDGSARKVPAGFFQLLTSPLFSVTVKALLPLKIWIPGVLPRRRGDYSVRDFFTPLIGSRAVGAVLDPVLKGIYGGEVDELSARTLFPGLWQAARQGSSIFGYMRTRKGAGGKPPVIVLKGGIQTLVDRLWGEIEPRVNFIPKKVERIIPGDGGKRYTVLLEGSSSLDVDGCLITTAGKRSAPLVGYLSEELSDQLVNLKAAALTVVHLKVPRSEPLIPGAFGVLFPGGMPANLLGVMFNSMLFPHVAPDDAHVLTVVLGGAQASDQLPNESELRQLLPQLLRQLLAIRNVEWLAMMHWPEAIPQLVVGHHKIVEQLDACEEKFPGIVFSGVDRGGVGVSDRIRVAREAARRLHRARVETAG